MPQSSKIAVNYVVVVSSPSNFFDKSEKLSNQKSLYSSSAFRMSEVYNESLTVMFKLSYSYLGSLKVL